MKLRKEKKKIPFVDCDYIEDDGEDVFPSDIENDWNMELELKETTKASVLIIYY